MLTLRRLGGGHRARSVRPPGPKPGATRGSQAPPALPAGVEPAGSGRAEGSEGFRAGGAGAAGSGSGGGGGAALGQSGPAGRPDARPAGLHAPGGPGAPHAQARPGLSAPHSLASRGRVRGLTGRPEVARGVAAPTPLALTRHVAAPAAKDSGKAPAPSAPSTQICFLFKQPETSPVASSVFVHDRRARSPLPARKTGK